jgi:hypothetical protein
MPHADALVDEIANELDTWPGVHIGRRADGAAIVRYESLELGLLHRERGWPSYRDLRGEDEPFTSQDPA